MELSSAMRRAIRKYEPIETDGLTLYPICVAEYEEFLTAKPAIEAMQQSFPARLLNVPLLSAYYAMELEAMASGAESPGLLSRCLLFLALSLRLGEGEEMEERLRRFQLVADREDPTRLKAVRFVLNGEERMEITPVQFHRLRPILAAQNGIQLESDDANPALVQAERDIAQANGPQLDVNLEDLLSSVAALSGAEEEEIDGWPVLKLQNRQKAISRALNFLVCGIGETQGAIKWKGGNPHPSPFYDRHKTDSAALVAMDQYLGGKGMEAVRNSGAAGPPMI